MTRILVLASMTFLLACNFAIDPRNAGDDKKESNDPKVSEDDRTLFYTATYIESSKTITYSATASHSSGLSTAFLAEDEQMLKVNEHDSVFRFLKQNVEPADLISTSITLKRNGADGDVVTELNIPRISIDQIPAQVSRAAGFIISLSGEAIKKGDFIDLELYDPETKESVAMYSLQPSIPGMESTVNIDGQNILITSGFMEWFSEFETGNSYLISVNRAPGGWSKQNILDYLVNFQVKYNSAHHQITVVP